MNIQRAFDKDIESVHKFVLIHSSDSRLVKFIEEMRSTREYTEGIELLMKKGNMLYGYALLTKIGIRTANEILPSLALFPFIVKDPHFTESFMQAIVDKADEKGYTSIVTLVHGRNLNKFDFKPARDEFGLEVEFPVKDDDFRARELTEDALYRQSGLLLFPDPFRFIFGTTERDLT